MVAASENSSREVRWWSLVVVGHSTMMAFHTITVRLVEVGHTTMVAFHTIAIRLVEVGHT